MSLLVTFPLAGHHTKDSGAVYNGRKEQEETMRIQERLDFFLNRLGIKTVKDNPHHTLSQVLSTIRPGSGSVVIDNHFNASANPNATGIECIVSDKSFAQKDDSYKMATEICEVASKLLGIKNRGVKPESQTPRKRLAVLHTKAGISVLIEWCFISNINDMKALDNNRDKVCEAVAQILKKYDDLR